MKPGLYGVLLLLCALVSTPGCTKTPATQAPEPSVATTPKDPAGRSSERNSETDGAPEEETGAVGGAADGDDDGADSAPEHCGDDEDPYAKDSFEDRIGILASPGMKGRLPGSEGDQKTRAHIAARFECLGLEPAFPEYSQELVDTEGHETANVIGVLSGTDANVSDEIVVISAHHDHLGADETGIYAGANDNASGVATLLAVAHALAKGTPPRRTVVFAAFASEEIGYDGSTWYVEHPPAALPLGNTLFVVNCDMVGTYADEGKVYALDARPGTPGRSALDAVKSQFVDLEIDLDEPGDTSDQVSFCEKGVPGLFFHTPDSECYHKPCDVPSHLDYPHLARTAALVGAVVTELANGEHGLVEARTAGCVPPPESPEEE